MRRRWLDLVVVVVGLLLVCGAQGPACPRAQALKSAAGLPQAYSLWRTSQGVPPSPEPPC